ncbi:MAG: MFS transporter [Chloroflexia bacterium]|nr:MFS transporter [Chloroflexia bacterium]
MSRERSVIAVVLLTTAMSSLDQSIVGVALLTLRRALRTDVGLIQWVVLIYQIGIIATLLVAGRVTDRAGARRVFLSGLALFTVASGLCGLSQAAWQLIASRGLQGIGAAMLLVSGQALLMEAYPARRRGSGMGFLHMAVAAGLTAGPSVGGALIGVAGWRAIFFVNIPLGLLGFWFAWRHLPRMTGTPATGTVFDRSIVRSWPLVAGLLVAFLGFVALASNMFLVPFALQSVLGLSPARAGLVMTAVPLTILVVAPLSGRLTDAVGPRWPATIGAAVVAAAIVLMAQLRAGTAVPFAVLALIVYGAGAGIFQAPNNAAVMTAAPLGAHGTVSGMLALARSLGQVAGVALASAVWGWRQGVYDRSPGAAEPLAGALGDAFLVLATVALLAVIVSLWRGDAASGHAEKEHADDRGVPRADPGDRGAPGRHRGPLRRDDRPPGWAG